MDKFQKLEASHSKGFLNSMQRFSMLDEATGGRSQNHLAKSSTVGKNAQMMNPIRKMGSLDSEDHQGFDTSNILRRHARNATMMGVPNTSLGKESADRRVLSPEPPRMGL